MNKRVIALGLILAACGCGKADKFSNGERNFGAVVEFDRWPPLAKGVAGYNLYMAETATGDYEKINDTPVTGGNIIVPDRELGKTYYFKLSAVGTNGMEGRQGLVILRKAGAIKNHSTKPSQP